MPAFLHTRMLTALALILIGIFLVACGTIAEEPRPTFEPTSTFARVERPYEDDDVVVVAGEPTNTSVPPTPTLELPTATPTPEETELATEIPTEEATAEATEAVEAGGEGEVSDLPGNPEYGAIYFESSRAPSTEQRCSDCHKADEPIPGLGPYLYGIATVAGSRVEGLTAEEYLYQSIVEPGAHIAPPQTDQPWPEELMPRDWSSALTEQDIWDIVAYLLTLDQERPE